VDESALLGFAGVADKRATTLILGSMPGQASLLASEYYAHPRNVFWDIMASLFNIPRTLPYPQRLQQLRQHRIALWDVVQQCQRPGSLDSAIVETSIVSNDFNQLFAICPAINAVFCNGGKAFALYKKQVLPTLDPDFQRLNITRLPSTSPAHAAMSLAEKKRQWSIIQTADRQNQ